MKKMYKTKASIDAYGQLVLSYKEWSHLAGKLVMQRGTKALL